MLRRGFHAKEENESKPTTSDEKQPLDRQGQDGFDTSPSGTFHERRKHDRARVGVAQGVSEGGRLRNEDVELLYQPGREGTESKPASRATTSKNTPIRPHCQFWFPAPRRNPTRRKAK